MATNYSKTKESLITAAPILSIVAGVVIVLVELIVIGFALISPQHLGLLQNIESLGSANNTVILSSEQRISLGVATVLIIIQAIVFGAVQTYKEFKHTVSNLYLIQSSQQDQKGTVVSSQSIGPTSAQPLIQDGRDKKYQVFYNSQPYLTNKIKVPYKDIDSNLKPVVWSRIAHYIAEVLFDVMDFLWKWTLAILVIRNNWASVVIAIIGGVGYPARQLWKAFFSSPEIPITKPTAQAKTI